MPITTLYYHPIFLEHNTGLNHPESPRRLQLILDLLNKHKIIEKPEILLQQPKTASEGDILRVHSKDHLERIRNLSESGGGFIDMDTVVSSKSYEAALFAAGAGITAAVDIESGKTKNAFALVRPPGHHATRTRAMGFCLFNNVAVLAEYLNKVKGVKRIAIVDIDAHHGNGTQDIFYDANHVLYFGLHQDGRTLYPASGFADEIGEGEGKGYTVNMPYPPGVDDDTYLKVFQKVCLPVMEQFKPGYILVSVGFDSHRRDPLTDMNLTTYAHEQIMNHLLRIAHKMCNDRLIVTLEGGYDPKAISHGALAVINQLAGLGLTIEEKKPASPPQKDRNAFVDKFTNMIAGFLKPYWKI